MSTRRITSALLCALACEPSSAGPRTPGSDDAAAPEPAPGGIVGRDLFTLTNLHPDVARRLLYSLNYQLPGLLPICTPIHVDAFAGDELRFTANGTQYTYALRHEYLTEGVDAHFARYFGETCDKGDALSQADRDGIAAGRVSPGMTKAGVIKAIGYPPPHATPNLDAPQWRYWENRWGTFIVHFEGDTVKSIQN